jgi:hypothetical protein
MIFVASLAVVAPIQFQWSFIEVQKVHVSLCCYEFFALISLLEVSSAKTARSSVVR